MNNPIWLRTSAHIPSPMADSNSGVSVVFYHLYTTMKKIGLDVVLDKPAGACLELWWGWDMRPESSHNPKALLTLGEADIEVMKHWEQFDHIFLTTRHGMARQTVDMPMSVWQLGADPDMFPIIVRNSSAFTFTHVGTAQYRKGSDIVCDTFAGVLGNKQGVRLEIRCPQGGGDMYDNLQREYAQQGNIVFISNNYLRQETWRHYIGDCLLFPSLREGWGLCLTEAMSTGMAALASRLPVLEDIFNDQCGWWIEMDDSVLGLGYGIPDRDSLRRSMIYAYEHQAEAFNKGQNAARFVRENLTWQHGIESGFLPIAEEYGWL